MPTRFRHTADAVPAHAALPSQSLVPNRQRIGRRPFRPIDRSDGWIAARLRASQQMRRTHSLGRAIAQCGYATVCIAPVAWRRQTLQRENRLGGMAPIGAVYSTTCFEVTAGTRLPGPACTPAPTPRTRARRPRAQPSRACAARTRPSCRCAAWSARAVNRRQTDSRLRGREGTQEYAKEYAKNRSEGPAGL